LAGHEPYAVYREPNRIYYFYKFSNSTFRHMPHILKNKNLEIQIDAPQENYNFSRFDWTGKITNVKFQGKSLTSTESLENHNDFSSGKGFYNEFGIDSALGFEEVKIGKWFHKIGIGLLKKTDNVYSFSKKYKIKPAKFTVQSVPNQLIISCQSELINGYAYVLTKTIELKENSFSIHYLLENTGEKAIITDEYVHNFIGINNSRISPEYQLKFPFQIKPKLFGETVNPEKKVNIGRRSFKFNHSPKAQFFFSNLSGNKKVAATWALQHLGHKIAITESGNFQTDKVNLWGWKHVICPELFFKINIAPNQAKEWTRQFEFYQL